MVVHRLVAIKVHHILNISCDIQQLDPLSYRKSTHLSVITNIHVATGKRGYPHNIFLISPRKHMLWVLIRSASPRHF